MDFNSERELKILAAKLRIDVLKSIYMAGSGHPGSSLSCLDILLYLYSNVLNISKDNYKNIDRDRFVLSKGHGAPALYAVLASRGFFDYYRLQTLRKLGSFLQGHPNMNSTAGVDMSTGSLGQGISAACGMALGLKLHNLDRMVYAILGDGELQEGQVFEALCFATHNKLNNLCIIIDNNGLQIDGSLEEVAGFSNIAEKIASFGLRVVSIDGHNFSEMEQAFEKTKQQKEKPTVIIAKTVKGKGVSFMENVISWHGKAPNKEQYFKAKEELEIYIKNLEGVLTF